MPDTIFSPDLPQQVQDITDLLRRADDAILSIVNDAKKIDLSCKGMDSYDKLLPMLAQVSTAYGTIRDTMTTVSGAAAVLNTVTAQYGDNVRQEILYLQQLQNQAQCLGRSIADLKEMQKAVTDNRTAWQQLGDEIRNKQTAMNEAMSSSATQIKSANEAIAASKQSTLKGEQDLARARYDLQKQGLELDKTNNKAVFDDQKQTLDKRLDAYRQYEGAQSKIAATEKDKAIAIAEDKMKQVYAKGVVMQAKGKLTPEVNSTLGNEYDAALLSREAAYERYNVQLENIADAAAKDLLLITRTAHEQWIGEQKTTLQTHLSNDEQAAYTELLHLQDRLGSGEIAYEEYGKKVLQLDHAYRKQMIADAITSDDETLKNETLTAQERLRLMQDRVAKEKQLLTPSESLHERKDNHSGVLQGLGGAIFSAGEHVPEKNAFNDFSDYEAAYANYTKKKEAFEQQFSQYVTQLAKETADAIIAIQDNRYEHEAQQLDKEERVLELRNTQQIQAINATTGYAITKQNELTRTNAQATAQENQIEAQKKELSVRKAKFDKAASIAEIIENTAVAIIKAWVECGGDPVTAIPLTALIAGIGAAQLAKAASTPIPQYARGTTDHIGGAAIVGEGGEREWIQPPSGNGFWSKAQSTLYHLPAHSSVTPVSELIKFAAVHIGNPAHDDQKDRGAERSWDNVVDRLGKSFAATGRDIAYTMLRNKPIVTVNINDGYKQKNLK